MQIFTGDCFSKYSFLDTLSEGDENLEKITTKICAHTNWIRYLTLLTPKYNSYEDKYKQLLITVSEDMHMKIWDIGQNICLSKTRLEFEVYCMTLVESKLNSLKNQYLALGGEAGVLIIYDYAKQEKIKELPKTLKNIINLVTFRLKNHKHEMIAASNTKGEIRVWNWIKGQSIFKIRMGIQPIHSMFIWNTSSNSRNIEPILIHSYEESINMWSINCKKRIKKINHHTNWIKSIILKTYKREAKIAHLLFSAGSDNTIIITNALSGICMNIIQVHKSGILNLEFYEDLLLSSACNGNIGITDLTNLTTKFISSGLTFDYYQSFQIAKISDTKVKIIVAGSQPRRAGYHYLHTFECNAINGHLSFGYS